MKVIITVIAILVAASWTGYFLISKPEVAPEVIKYVGPELTPVSGCFITEDQFLICKLGG